MLALYTTDISQYVVRRVRPCNAIACGGVSGDTMGAIGFPWISLDSLVQIVTYQWVMRQFRGNKIRSPPPWAGEARRRELSDADRPEGLLMKGQCNKVSDFLQ